MVLADSGHDLAPALQTIIEIGDGVALATTIKDAFDATVSVDHTTPRFSVKLHQTGLLRALDCSEFSDGTLRYILLTTALLTPRPPELMVLNEPEASLHRDLIPPLARLIVRASTTSQMIVVTHSPSLIELLASTAACRTIELSKEFGETHVLGRRRVDVPQWSWPAG